MTTPSTDKARPDYWPDDLDFGPEDLITSIENLTGEKLDVTGEPWWKRLWFKILRIA